MVAKGAVSVFMSMYRFLPLKITQSNPANKLNLTKDVRKYNFFTLKFELIVSQSEFKKCRLVKIIDFYEFTESFKRTN